MKRFFQLTVLLFWGLSGLCSCIVESAREPQSVDDLEGLTVCVMEGSIQADYASAYLARKGVDVVYFASFTDCLLSVSMGQSDVFFGSDIHTYNQSFREKNMKVLFENEEISTETSYAVNKKNIELRDALNAFIDSLDASGELKEIRDRWFDRNNTDFHDCVVIDPISGDEKGDGPVYTLGISGVKQPSAVMVDNKWTGYEIELLQRFVSQSGGTIRIMVFDFHNLIPALQAETVDVIAATLSITPERGEKVEFIHPTARINTLFIGKGDGPAKVSFVERIRSSFYSSLVKENRWKLITDGLLTSIIITLFSLLFGSFLGAFICWMRMSKRLWLQKFAGLYVYVMRNIPMLVFLMLMFYVFLARTGQSPISVAIVAFSMNSAAFISEIIRTGILSVDRGQTEAGRALGCSAVMTFTHIVAPQAARRVAPVFKNECVSLLKGTSIVGYISIVDLTKGSDLIRSSSFEAFFPLLVISLIYFILAGIITWAVGKILD